MVTHPEQSKTSQSQINLKTRRDVPSLSFCQVFNRFLEESHFKYRQVSIWGINLSQNLCQFFIAPSPSMILNFPLVSQKQNENWKKNIEKWKSKQKHRRVLSVMIRAEILRQTQHIEGFEESWCGAALSWSVSLEFRGVKIEESNCANKKSIFVISADTSASPLSSHQFTAEKVRGWTLTLHFNSFLCSFQSSSCQWIF